jgi:hypothetical protein
MLLHHERQYRRGQAPFRLAPPRHETSILNERRRFRDEGAKAPIYRCFDVNNYSCG